MGISLDKIQAEAPELLSIAKNADTLLKSRNLTGLTAEVALALDFSGSMRPDYKSGAMQRLLDKVLGIATQLDDDGEIDLYIFATQAEYLGKVNLKNFRGIIDKFTAGKHMGTTNYADTFKKVVAQYNHVAGGKTGGIGSLFTKKSGANEPLAKPADKPGLVFFITDGVPDSKPAAVKELIAASYRPIFWQFLSIGSEEIVFLKKLDNEVKGRWIDNANYKEVGQADQLTDTQLLTYVLEEYPDWVEEERFRKQIL